MTATVIDFADLAPFPHIAPSLWLVQCLALPDDGMDRMDRPRVGSPRTHREQWSRLLENFVTATSIVDDRRSLPDRVLDRRDQLRALSELPGSVEAVGKAWARSDASIELRNAPDDVILRRLVEGLRGAGARITP